MNVLIAVDSFKGSLTSLECGKAVQEGIHKANPDIKTVIRPISDGGEGSLDSIVSFLDSEIYTIETHDPLGRIIESNYAILKETNTAVIEVSSTVGLPFLRKDELNPLIASTYGIGEQILDALSKGVKEFVIGLGGSSTNDAGMGLLLALGYRFFDQNNIEFKPTPSNIKNLQRIDDTNVTPLLKGTKFQIACDVNNPLLGEKGASYIFGPQKGADQDMILKLDEALKHFSTIVQKQYPQSNPNLPGSGAAGGLGYCFSTFLNGTLRSGIDLIADLVGIEALIKTSDIIITGEGFIDHQTIMGKAPIGIAKLAKKYNKPVIAIAGGVGPTANQCHDHGIDAIFSVINQPMTLEEAMDHTTAYNNVVNTAEEIFRLTNTI